MSKQRILIVSSLFPPHVLGGAESSAYNLALHFRDNGWDVGVLTTALDTGDAVDNQLFEGMRMWRVLMPRPYATFHFQKAKGLQKLLWHFLDHFDPRNKRIMADVLDNFKPDVVSIHLLQGLGYNALQEITRRNIKINFVLHDLGLACIRMNMFKNGSECAMQCTSCKISSAYKWNMLKQSKKLGFISPSQANIETLSRFLPIKSYRNQAILNPNTYPPATAQRVASDNIRFLYVGRLHNTKGVDLLLNVLLQLKDKYKFKVTVIGDGQESASLRATYAKESWCDFTGYISQSEISNYMVNSDVMFIPSIWAENSPGVVVHALSLGLPVMGSRKGGIPELIKDGITGKVIEAGNKAAWRDAIEAVLQKPEILEEWRNNCLVHIHDFEITTIVKQQLEFASHE
ncbi:MAG: glycosyltransferase family 4 protein [Alphaproteobacteria bacterium]|nr:glycosyltransferase family 4 protein [Alphaproteobacteria bacterium]